jgi:hypothetical protein
MGEELGGECKGFLARSGAAIALDHFRKHRGQMKEGVPCVAGFFAA